jgi:pyruvate dehydrogenase E2 component (dihydrolipoamide acetyltransferase)
MPIEIIIPRLGWSMEEGIFVNWLKKDGEPVKSGELLFTLENEKATEDVEAVESGILRIPEDGPKTGQVVKVGQVIGHLLMENESFVAGLTDPVKTPHRAEAAQEIKRVDYESNRGNPSPAGEERENISPRARRLAAELGIHVRQLRGSGRTGRIREKDVREAAGRVSLPGISTMRRTIAQQTSQSFSSIPHFYLRAEVDVTALIHFRNEMLAEVEGKAGVRLTLTDLLLRAQARALKNVPSANAIWKNGNIIEQAACDVGLVVRVTDGMRIPIVRSPEAGTLAGLAQQRSSLVKLARSGKLNPESMQGGASSLSNLGNTRVDEFAAVILPGQSSMLAAGRASQRPFVVEGELSVRTTLRLCLSVDHRVLDGGPAAEFLDRIIDLLDQPQNFV